MKIDWKSLGMTFVVFLGCLIVYKIALPYLQRVPIVGALLPTV